MKLLVVSDLHLEFDQPYEGPDRGSYDVVVLAGDVHLGVEGIKWATAKFAGTPVIYVMGNHEYYGYHLGDTLAQARQAAAGTNVILLENDTACLGDVRFIGATLWTDFRLFGSGPQDVIRALAVGKRTPNDFRLIRHGSEPDILTPEATVLLHEESRRFIETELAREDGRRKIVVTHHLPGWRSVAARYRHDVLSACFASDLGAAVGKPDLWIHGHTHTPFDYVEGGCRIVCNPRGYPRENRVFDPFLVVEV